MKSKDLLRPIKSLTKKLNNDYQQVEALISQKRQTTLKKQLERLTTKANIVTGTGTGMGTSTGSME